MKETALIAFLLTIPMEAMALSDLSTKALQLQMGASREAVITLLGPPTWAIVSTDKGEYALPDPSIRLELFWRNPGCAPVAVDFDANLRAIGWDGGQLCAEGVEKAATLPDKFRCTQSDRSRVCGGAGRASTASDKAPVATSQKKREEGQRWVMEHVRSGSPWKPSSWKERFGSWEELPVTQWNPNIIKAYYFASIDVTLVVNVLKNEINAWRIGRVSS